MHLLQKHHTNFFLTTCILLSLVTAIHPLPFLYGIEIYFISAFSWFVYRKYSVQTAISVSLIVVSVAIFFFGQTPLLALAPVELMVVGWIVNKSGRSILFGAFLYWLTIGLILHWMGYAWLSQNEMSYPLLFLMFQIAGGLLNVLIADIVAEYLPYPNMNKLSSDKLKWRLDKISFHLCMVLLVFPISAFLLISGNFVYQETIMGITDKFQTMRNHVNEQVNRLSEKELRDLHLHSALQKSALQKMFTNLTTDSDFTLTLVDKNGQVITSQEPEVKNGATNYDWGKGGDIRLVNQIVSLWQPDGIPSYLNIARWKNTEYVAEFTLERVPYTLIVKQPAASFQHSVFRLYSISLLMVFALILIAGVAASWATLKFSRSLSTLGDYTTGLPRKIKLRTSTEWRDSQILEVDVLKNNFVDMSKELESMFYEINQSEMKMRQLVHYDTLTGLANRYSFNLYLPALIQKARENSERIACLFIDLDRFKFINDTYGHEAGDTVLKAVGERLLLLNGDSIKAFRLAGDEFIVIASHPLPADVMEWGRQIHRALVNKEVQCGDVQLSLQLSAGIALFPEHGSDAESLLRKSDEAMYRGKVSGRNQVRILTQEDPMGGLTT